jgi:hypothetical protein
MSQDFLLARSIVRAATLDLAAAHVTVDSAAKALMETAFNMVSQASGKDQAAKFFAAMAEHLVEFPYEDSGRLVPYDQLTASVH